MPRSIGRPVYRLYQMAWAGLDWLYPPQCGGCSRPGARWCSDCLEQVELILPPVCRCCGQALAQEGLCVVCQASAPAYTALRSWGKHSGPLREAVLRLKYQGDIALGEALSRPMIDLLYDLNWPIEWVTPVPSGVARIAERGYNQASLLARPIAMAGKLVYKPQALYKTRNTRSQVGLSAAERRENVRDVFAAADGLVEGRTILVVDDVTTSGATMQSCAQALLEAGAAAVYGLTLARPNLPAGDEEYIPDPAALQRMNN